MQNNKNKRYFSIKTRVTIGIVIFVLVSFIIVFTVSFLEARYVVRDNLKKRILDVASVASLSVDVASHEKIKGPTDMNSESYNKIKDELQSIKDKSTDITYVYTMRENDKNQISFIVDAISDSSDVTHVGDVYFDANQFLLDNFLKMDKPMVEQYFTSDKWGTWISAYAPLYGTDGHRDGVLGVDVSANSVLKKERQLLYVYILVFIVIAILTTLLGSYLSNKILNSINYLTKAIKEGESDFFGSVNNDEVGELADVLKNKLNQVYSSKQEAEEHNINNTKMLERMNKLMVGRELEMIKLKKEIEDLKNNNK